MVSFMLITIHNNFQCMDRPYMLNLYKIFKSMMWINK